jgi:hypothetical protein
VSSLKGLAKLLPGQAMHALAQVPKEALLVPWQGGVALALYAIAIAGLGWVALERRDVG